MGQFLSPFVPLVQRIGSLEIYVTPDVPKMQLSARVCEVLSPEVIEETNRWMIEFFGVTNILNDNDAVVICGKRIHMNPRMYARFKAAVTPSAEVFDLADYRR